MGFQKFLQRESFHGMLRACFVEFIGTFYLALYISLSKGNPLVPPLILMVMVFAGGHISMASYNPAVNIALLIRGGIGLFYFLGYTLVQIVAGILAALVARIFTSSPTIPDINGNIGHAFLAEFIGTYALAYVVLNAGTSEDYEGNSFFGVAIGFTVGAGALVFGPISGGVFNPAVGFLTIIGSGWSHINGNSIWIYFLAPCIAGVLAALFFRLTSPEDHMNVDDIMRGPRIHSAHLHSTDETSSLLQQKH